MTLDLIDLTSDWNCPSGEISARAVIGRDGGEFVQLRVDLGVLQMWTDGRPDGQRYCGAPSALAHVQRERGKATPDDWRELERELYQLNYRRLAFTSLMDESLRRGREAEARRHLERALRDMEDCLSALDMLCERHNDPNGQPALRAALTFNRARLRVQNELLRGTFDEAVEQAESGRGMLEEVLLRGGLEPEQVEQEPGIVFLADWAQRLRRDHNVEKTLRQQLDDAVEAEDFEAAARLHDELLRRKRAE